MSFTVGMIFVMLASVLVTWLARRKVLAWVQRTLDEERDKKLERETAALISAQQNGNGYQSLSSITRIPTETYNADDEEEDDLNDSDDDRYTLNGDVEHTTSWSSEYIYHPQSQQANVARPRVYQIPAVEARQMSKYNEKSKIPDEGEHSDGGLFGRLSSSVKEFVSMSTP